MASTLLLFDSFQELLTCFTWAVDMTHEKFVHREISVYSGYSKQPVVLIGSTTSAEPLYRRVQFRTLHEEGYDSSRIHSSVIQRSFFLQSISPSYVHELPITTRKLVTNYADHSAVGSESEANSQFPSFLASLSGIFQWLPTSGLSLNLSIAVIFHFHHPLVIGNLHLKRILPIVSNNQAIATTSLAR